MITNENKYIDALRQKQYLAIIHSKEYKDLINDMCSRIICNAKTAPNEATIENYFDCELFSLFRNLFEPLGFNYKPIKEVAIETSRHITCGRADTAIGALVIEFKQVSTLSNDKLQQKAINQISDYLLGMELENELIGFITDGTKGCFILRHLNGITVEKFHSLDFHMINRLVQTIFRLELTALSSKNLVDNFCNPPENDGVAFKLVKTLYNSLSGNMTSKTRMLYNEWKELFNLAHDDISKQQAILNRKKSLENPY